MILDSRLFSMWEIIFDKVDATNFPIYSRTEKFKIGYVPQHGGYFHDLTLLENLNAIGEILVKEKITNIFLQLKRIIMVMTYIQNY